MSDTIKTAVVWFLVRGYWFFDHLCINFMSIVYCVFFFLFQLLRSFFLSILQSLPFALSSQRNEFLIIFLLLLLLCRFEHLFICLFVLFFPTKFLIISMFYFCSTRRFAHTYPFQTWTIHDFFSMCTTRIANVSIRKNKKKHKFICEYRE